MRKFLTQFAPVLLASAAVSYFGWHALKRTQTVPASTTYSVVRRPAPAPGKGKPGKVVSVQDGDSLTILINGQQTSVRLCGIDAPELAQPLGEQAKLQLQQLINWSGKQVIVVPTKPVTRSGQVVAEVFTAARKGQPSGETTLLNYQLVRLGMAYLYPQFVQDCPDKEAIAEAEAQAKQQQQGVWLSFNPTRPWDYRRQQFISQILGSLAQVGKLHPLNQDSLKNYLSDEVKPSAVAAATWYGPFLQGRLTANGEIFNQDDLTAAHPSLPFDTHLKVTNLKNSKSVIVRINDRKPPSDHPTIDLSRAAAARLGALQDGLVPVELEVVKPEAVQPAKNSTSSR